MTYYYFEGIFLLWNMNKAIEIFKKLLGENVAEAVIELDAPDHPDGHWWIDVRAGKRHFVIEYRPGRGFGVFDEKTEFGEGPAEIYRTPELVVRRLKQLAASRKGKRGPLSLKDLRELYECSQVDLAKKVGVQQSAISRFEQREEVKLGTLEAAINALGGRLEIRAHFSDSDVPIAI